MHRYLVVESQDHYRSQKLGRLRFRPRACQRVELFLHGPETDSQNSRISDTSINYG